MHCTVTKIVRNTFVVIQDLKLKTHSSEHKIHKPNVFPYLGHCLIRLWNQVQNQLTDPLKITQGLNKQGEAGTNNIQPGLEMWHTKNIDEPNTLINK